MALLTLVAAGVALPEPISSVAAGSPQAPVAVAVARAERTGCLLHLLHLLGQCCRSLVDLLKLREVAIEHTDDL